MNLDVMILFFLISFSVCFYIYSIFYLLHQSILGKLPLSWKYWGLVLFAYGGNIFFFIYAYMYIVYDFAFFPNHSWLYMIESLGIYIVWIFANYILLICLEEIKRTWERIGYIHHKRYVYIENIQLSSMKKTFLFGIGYMIFLSALMSLY